MTDLIISLGLEKGSRAHAKKVIEDEDWDNIYIICDKESSKDFSVSKDYNPITIDLNDMMSEISELIQSKLKGKVKGFEVGLNIISGTGKQNMALISALLKLGLAIRLVALTKEGIKEL